MTTCNHKIPIAAQKSVRLGRSVPLDMFSKTCNQLSDVLKENITIDSVEIEFQCYFEFAGIYFRTTIVGHLVNRLSFFLEWKSCKSFDWVRLKENLISMNSSRIKVANRSCQYMYKLEERRSQKHSSEGCKHWDVYKVLRWIMLWRFFPMWKAERSSLRKQSAENFRDRHVNGIWKSNDSDAAVD